MGRFEGVSTMVNGPRSLALALIIGSAVVALAVPAQAESTKTKHTHSAASSKQATKTPPGGCQPTPDQASIGMRALQTELMVAGLKCSAEQWNSFTGKFKATLKTDADRMQHLFSKAYGKGGPSQMNAFVTQLANDASQRSNGFSEADYCKQQDVLFQKVLALTAIELERFSAMRPLTTPAPVALCKPEDAPAPAITTAAATTTPPATVAATTAPPPTASAAALRR